MSQRIRSWLIVVALSAAMTVGALGTPQPSFGKSARLSKNRQMEENRSHRDRLCAKVKELSASGKLIGEDLNELDGRIGNKGNEIKARESELNRCLGEQDNKRVELQREQVRLAELQGLLRDRARAIYMQPELSYVDIVFEALFVDRSAPRPVARGGTASGAAGGAAPTAGPAVAAPASFTDVVERVFFLQAIFKRDQLLIQNVRVAQARLADRVAQLEQQITAIKDIKQKLEEQKSDLEDTKAEKQLVLEAIANDKALAQRQMNELEEEYKRIAAYLRSITGSGGGYKGTAWSGSFKKPCPGEITSPYGMRFHPILHVWKMHTGVDISCAEGTTLKAAGNGKVVFAGWRGGYGLCVLIEHGGGRSTLYGHMSRITCKEGDIVSTSTKLGEVGQTGMATGPHCHFEVRINGEARNPLTSLD